jgi:predicted ATPase
MPFAAEMRRLQNKWRTGTGWPKRLEWLEINGLRGWVGQHVDFAFPIVAVVGENGAGKSTVLQAAASCYRAPQKKDDLFASDFFPDTPFEHIAGASIRFSFREGTQSTTRLVLKPTDRWRRNPDRPERRVEYIDLSRIQPVGARAGYSKLLKANVTEGTHSAFEAARLERFSTIMGRTYAGAGMSFTSADNLKSIPVVQHGSARYSGFHSGAGEIAAAELLAADFPRYGLILIDEVETSLHPRAQRRLIRDLARLARENELQILITTHSPYVLEEIPPEGRMYIMDGAGGKTLVTGVSPEFAMTRMDEEQHPECDVYVEDNRAATLVGEMIVAQDRDLLSRLKLIPYGTASVGMALGQMANQQRFPRASVVFLDGDQAAAPGCNLLPGDDAPERVVFERLRAADWPDVAMRVGRGTSETIDALTRAVSASDHHDWVRAAADRLILGGDSLWQAMCASFATHCADQSERESIRRPVQDAIDSVN